MTARMLLPDLPASAEAKTHAANLKQASLERLFEEDDSRAEEFTLDAAGLQLDYSKHLLNRDALAALLNPAAQAGLDQSITDLFSGEPVNTTEDRPALHTLLRASSSEGHTDKFKDVVATRERMQTIALRLNRGEHTGYSVAVITDGVNIALGGSDLCP